MSSIERLLTDITPLPLDVIHYCIQPYLIRPRQWKKTFAHVIESINFLGASRDYWTMRRYPPEPIWQTLSREQEYLHCMNMCDVENELYAMRIIGETGHADFF